MSSEQIDEARRQLQICNACRYCESLCAVFPAVHSRRSFADQDIRLLADLCHNCRGCYYACQYTPPHEFALNLPSALAEIRQSNWQENAVPRAPARLFQRSGVAMVVAVTIGFALILGLIAQFSNDSAAGFYGLLPHNVMIALFIPAFLLPIAVIAMSLWRYWRNVGGGRLAWSDLAAAFSAATNLRNLDGGHGEGCNFEDEDRFSNLRRYFHQATMYGFLMCFAATSVATLLHYLFDQPAPYPFWSAPKLLGVFGGILLSLGCVGLAVLKLKADRALGAEAIWGGEMGFVVLLFVVSTSGLVLYWFGDSGWLRMLLALHLGAVLAFFLLMPYTKMVHGFYRLAALARNAADRV